MRILGFGEDRFNLRVGEIPTTGNVCVIDCDLFLEVGEMIQRRSQSVGAARYGTPAFGGGFFLPRVIHRPSGPNYRFEPQNASQALLLVLQAIKKPAVTCTSGQVMGELTIWPSS